MFPTLRFVVATILIGLLVVTAGINLILNSPNPSLPSIGMRSARGSPLDASLREHPAWIEQRQALAVVQRAVELNRLRRLPVSPTVFSVDPDFSGAAETAVALRVIDDDMLAEQAPAAANEPAPTPVPDGEKAATALLTMPEAAAPPAPAPAPELPARTQAPDDPPRPDLEGSQQANAPPDEPVDDIMVEEPATGLMEPLIENAPMPRMRPAPTRRSIHGSRITRTGPRAARMTVRRARTASSAKDAQSPATIFDGLIDRMFGNPAN